MNGTWALVRLALRRDRILLPAWVLGLGAMAGFSVTATKDLYTSPDSLLSAAETINATAALVALYGKIYDPTSLGAISLIKLTAFGAAMVAILMAYIVIRHSRSEEESGRLELVAAGETGRSAPLAAALIVAGGASVALGLVSALGVGGAGLPWEGAFAFGTGWALAGLVFAAVGAVAAQLTTSARAALGLTIAAVGVAYVLRAVGDLAQGDPGWLSWLSPIGWSQQIRPFAGDRWWVTALPLVATAVLVPVAFALRSRRDLGFGFLPDRAGPAHGRIGGVNGLAWRLQRGVFTAWLAGSVLGGFVLGSVAHNVTGLLDSPEMQKYIAVLGGKQGLTDAFLAAEVAILGTIAAAYAITASTRLRSEEAAGHAELLLATATTRRRWAASHVLVALAGSAAILVAIGAAIGLAHGLAVDDLSQVPRLIGATLAQIPAAWVMGALVVLLFGFAPRAVPAAWVLFVLFVVFGEFGPLWDLPQWLLDLSPFAHSPNLPGGEFSAGQIGLLLATAAVLLAGGFSRWRVRDLEA